VDVSDFCEGFLGCPDIADQELEGAKRMFVSVGLSTARYVGSETMDLRRLSNSWEYKVLRRCQKAQRVSRKDEG